MNKWAHMLKEIPIGERTYVQWLYPGGVAPSNSQEFTGTIIAHNATHTHIKNDRGTNLYMHHGNALLDVDWL